MKKITMQIGGKISTKKAEQISASLSSLNGVISADVNMLSSHAYAYTNDKLNATNAAGSLQNEGFSAVVVKEEYIG